MVPSENLTKEPEADRTVCFCHNVSYLTLKRAIRTAGCNTLEKIQSETCASTGCGGCEFEVIDILEETLREVP